MNNSVLKALKSPKFDRILVIWSCPATRTIYVRDRMTGKSKLINLI